MQQPKLRTLIALLALSLGGLAQGQDLCEVYGAPVVAASLQGASLHEASGLVWSAQQPGVLWTHNDSGDGPYVLAFFEDGRHLGTWQVLGAGAVDWEDIATGPCQGGDTDRRCLYIADSGNNNLDRQDLAIYRVQEPLVDLQAATPTTGQITGVERLPFRYAGDAAFDCESLMVHPQTGAMFWVTKSLSGESQFYYWPSFDAPTTGGLASLELVGSHHFGRVPILQSATTGADFAPDGQRLVVRTYQRAHEFVLTGESTTSDQVRDQVRATIQGQALVWSIPAESQGEAVGYAPDGHSIWTTTEGQNPPLSRFDCARWQPTQGEDTSAEDTTAPDADTPEQTTPEQTLDSEQIPPHPSSSQPGRCGCGQLRTESPRSAPLPWMLMGLGVVLGLIFVRRHRPSLRPPPIPLVCTSARRAWSQNP